MIKYVINCISFSRCSHISDNPAFSLTKFKQGNCHLTCIRLGRRIKCYSTLHLTPAFFCRCGHKSSVVLLPPVGVPRSSLRNPLSAQGCRRFRRRIHTSTFENYFKYKFLLGCVNSPRGQAAGSRNKRQFFLPSL